VQQGRLTVMMVLIIVYIRGMVVGGKSPLLIEVTKISIVYQKKKELPYIPYQNVVQQKVIIALVLKKRVVSQSGELAKAKKSHALNQLILLQNVNLVINVDINGMETTGS